MRLHRGRIAILAATALAVAVAVPLTTGSPGSSAPAHTTVVSAKLTSILKADTREASDTTGTGYWLVSSAGAVYAFGTAGFYGSMVGKHLNAPITGIIATSDAKGYWLVGADGGVFAFGDADFMGSLGGSSLVAPIPTPPALPALPALPAPSAPLDQSVQLVQPDQSAPLALSGQPVRVVPLVPPAPNS